MEAALPLPGSILVSANHPAGCTEWPQDRGFGAGRTPAHAEGQGRDSSRTSRGQWGEDAGEGGHEEDAPQQAPILSPSENLG